jgi:hypothetical protein
MPEFTHDSARRLWYELAPSKPPPEVPPDFGPSQFIDPMGYAEREQQRLASAQTSTGAAAMSHVTAPVAPDQHSPYLDDDGRLRDPSGRLVDVMGEDWWQQPWYRQAADLLRQAGYEHVDEESE